MAALLGQEAKVYVPAGTVAARIDAIVAERADCVVIAGTYKDAVDALRQEHARCSGQRADAT